METAEERMVKLATEMAGGAVLEDDQVTDLQLSGYSQCIIQSMPTVFII
jgi:hypothetical protein